MKPLKSHDGRYLDLPIHKKADCLKAYGATSVEPIPRELPAEAGYRYVMVLYNPAFDAALMLTQRELDRCWDWRDRGGDDRPYEMYRVPEAAFE